MKALDRFIQSRRLAKIAPYLLGCERVLDIGCADGRLFKYFNGLRDGVGIDPDMTVTSQPKNAFLIRGRFPQDMPDMPPFDALTMLAVLEHIPIEDLSQVAAECARFLKIGGRLIITVPSPVTDYVLASMRFLRLIHGMSLEQHYGFDVRCTVPLFTIAGFRLIVAKKFQLGLNNLFVFERRKL